MDARRKPLGKPHLLVAAMKDGAPVWEGKWRDPNQEGGKQIKRRLGPAWLEEDDDTYTRLRRRTRHAGWLKRSGQPRNGCLDEEGALVALREAQWDYEAEQKAKAEPVIEAATFEEAADGWLGERLAVGGIKPSVLRDYAAMLRDPDHAPAKRGRAPRARLMRTFGGRDVADVTSSDVRAWIAELDSDPTIGPRAINKHRQVLAGIMRFAIEQGWRDDDPVQDVPKRREPAPRELVTYSVEQVRAIAAEAVSEQDAAITITAAMSGMRQGELLELRWRDMRGDTIHVQRSLSAGVAGAPKSGKGRSMPLAQPVADVLAALREREHFTAPGDLVFCGATGRHLDGGSVTRRYEQARDRARAKDSTMPKLGFRELRDTFGTLCVANGENLLAIQHWMGHADIKTTMRYLHHAPRADDAARLTAIFGS